MKIALLHRYPWDQIKSTNAAFDYLATNCVDVLTFKKFDRRSGVKKFWKSILWIFYAPILVIGKGYDVVFCDDSYPFYPALVKMVSPKSRVVIRIGDFHLMYYYSGIAYKFLHAIEKWCWKKADEIIAISEVMAEYICKEIKRSVHIVLDPIDPLDFLPADMLKIPDRIVMFHGVITKNKNIDIMLEAAKRMPEIKFWIVGDGPDLKRLKELSTGNVYFYGWRPYKWVYSFINQCDVGLALRSNNPGNEFVVTSPFLQYGVMGKPCLVTRRAVFDEYPWQFTGIEEMVLKLYKLFNHPEEGEKLRQYVLKNHNAKDIAEKIWKILTSV